MSAGSEEQRAVRVLALGEQIHLCSPLTLAVSNHPNRLGVQSPLSLRNPLPRKHVRPSDQETGEVRSSDEEEDSPLPACTAPLSKFLSGDLYTKPQTCCRCESVRAAVPTVAENPLELRRLFPAPGGLCATGSEIPATVPRLAFPRTLLPSRESMHPSWPSHATLPSTGELPGWRDLGCIRASMWPRCANIPKSTPSTDSRFQP